MQDSDINNWVETLYPDGKIDWREEHQRLLTAIQQARWSNSAAADSVLKIGIEVGNYLQSLSDE